MLEDFGPPFADVNADFALQSSDDKLFRVHKLILQKTSGFFSTFPFDTAIPETRTHDDDLPILVLAEPSRVLGHLLRIVYSMRLPSSLFSMMDTHLLLAAAEKYMVEGVGDRVEGWLACSGQLERSPLEAYSLACRHKLLDTARRAARITLSQSFNALVEQSNPELLNLRTGADCTRLERYRSACTLAARVLCSTMAWGRRHSGPLSVSSFWDCQRCNEENTTGRDNTVARASLWWSNYLERAREEVERIPSGASVTNPSILLSTALKAAECLHCTRVIARDMKGFVEHLASKIETDIDAVELRFD